MPQKILCAKCNAILYEGFELESPQEIIAVKNGTCPGCGKSLEFTPESIRIVPLSQSNGSNE